MNFAVLFPVRCPPPAGAKRRRDPRLRAFFLFVALSAPAVTSWGQLNWSRQQIYYADGVNPGNVYTNAAADPFNTFTFNLSTPITVTELGQLTTRVPYPDSLSYDKPPVDFFVVAGATLIMDQSNFAGPKVQSGYFWGGADVRVQGNLLGNLTAGTVIFNHDFDLSGGYSVGSGDGGFGGNLTVNKQATVIFKGNYNSQGAYTRQSGSVAITDSTVEFQGNFNNRSSDMIEGNAVVLHDSSAPGDTVITDSVVTYKGTVDSSVSRPDIATAYDGGRFTISGGNSVVTFEQRVDQSGDGKFDDPESASRRGAGGGFVISDGAAVVFQGDLVGDGAAGGTATGNGGGISISGDGTSVTFEGTVSRLAGLRSDNSAGRSGYLTLAGGTARFETGSALQIARADGAGAAGIVQIQGGTLEIPTLGWLTNPASFRGGMTFTAGTLRTTAASAGAAVSVGSSSALGAGFNAAATGDRTLDTKDNLTFDATVALNGAGTFTKAGTGTLTLAGTNTYTGATVVAGGKLVIDGSLASTSVAIHSGAALGGSGSFAGVVSLGGGATLAPGNSPGTITFADGLTLASGSILDFQLGTVSDLIAVTGGVLTGPGGTGGITLNLSDAGGFAAGSYTLFDFSTGGTTTSDFDLTDFVVGSSISGYSYNLAFNGSTLALTATASAVPEPSTSAAFAGALVLGLAAWRRRRRAA